MRILGVVVLLTLASCAHHRDVRPAASGVHSVKVMGENKVDPARNALKQANHYCEQEGRRAAIVKEEVKFVGSGSEESYKRAKGISKAVKSVGGAAYVFGGKKEQDAGALAGIGGQAADAYLGDGYQAHMTFKCQ